MKGLGRCPPLPACAAARRCPPASGRLAGKGEGLCRTAAGPSPRSFLPPASRGAVPEPLPSGPGGFPSPLPASVGVGAQGNLSQPPRRPRNGGLLPAARPRINRRVKPTATPRRPAPGPAAAALPGPGLGTPSAAKGSGARPPRACPIGKQSPLPPTHLDKPAALPSCLMSDQTSNYETGKN